MKQKEQGFSLIEITLSVFVLSIGICSILSIFPVAMRWGNKSMSSNTGSLAARTTLAYLVEDGGLAGLVGNPASAVDGNYKVGNPGKGGYFVEYSIADIGIAPCFSAMLTVYRTDYTVLSGSARNAAVKNIYCVFSTYVFDWP